MGSPRKEVFGTPVPDEYKPRFLGFLTEEQYLRNLAKMSKGVKGVVLAIRKPQILPLSAVVRSNRYFIVAKGENTRHLEKWIRAHRREVAYAIFSWILKEIDQL